MGHLLQSSIILTSIDRMRRCTWSLPSQRLLSNIKNIREHFYFCQESWALVKTVSLRSYVSLYWSFCLFTPVSRGLSFDLQQSPSKHSSLPICRKFVSGPDKFSTEIEDFNRHLETFTTIWQSHSISLEISNTDGLSWSHYYFIFLLIHFHKSISSW